MGGFNGTEENATGVSSRVGLTLQLDEITTQPRAAARVAARLRAATEALPAQGGSPFALWAPQIGGGMNQLVSISAWAGEPRMEKGAAQHEADPEIARVRRRILDPLARGERTPPETGICTTRWFLLAPENVPELVNISMEAWNSFEDDSPAQVIGLWRCRTVRPDEEAEVMMMTHYPSLAVWEATRFWKPDAPGTQAQRRRATWSALFRRRRELLLDTWVIVQGPPSTIS